MKSTNAKPFFPDVDRRLLGIPPGQLWRLLQLLGVRSSRVHRHRLVLRNQTLHQRHPNNRGQRMGRQLHL